MSTALQNSAEGTAERLGALEEEARDLAYMRSQVAMHQQALDLLDHTLIPNARSEALRALLTQARATVAQHLTQAEDLFDDLR